MERDRVEIEILEDATRGVFGFWGRKARIRATVRASLFGAGPEGGEGGAGSPQLVSRGTSLERVVGEVVSTELANRARSVLAEILDGIGVSCTISVRDDAEAEVTVLEVSGDSSGLLIGRRGQMLDALEFILNRIVAREDEGCPTRVVVDVERYRERRREYLENLAHRLAEKAKQTGRVVALNPMSPRDRRVIHMTLQGDSTVATRSQGEGQYRKILILPADRRAGGARPSQPV